MEKSLKIVTSLSVITSYSIHYTKLYEVYAISGLIMLSMFSCGNKKATTLEELKKKYDGKEFKNCDKFIEAANEMMEVYFATVDKAVEGDEQAKKDVEAFDDFMQDFESQAEKFEKECPDKYRNNFV